jgi:hypothetical protein
MSDPSSTSHPQNLLSSPSATSSPGSEDGAMPCDSQDGPMTSQSGPDHAHASPSQMLESSSDSKTPGTSGRCSLSSSLGVALQRSLESRLRRRLGAGMKLRLGSNLYLLIWVMPVTSSGLRYSRLHRKVLPTFEKDCTLSPTPMASGIRRIGLPEIVLLMTSGKTPSGSDAEIENGELVNPGFALWLMGYPDTWLSSGVRAMQSFLSRRRSSSRRSSKRGAK